jgi:ketosteroid isomerase-like protein
MILRKLKLALGLAAFLAAGAAVSGAVPVFAPATAEAQENLEAQAKPAIADWLDAVYKRDPAMLDVVLAPEFQLMRADGTTFDKAGYVVSKLPIFVTAPQIEELSVTGTAELFVARYLVTARQTRDGVALQTTAPRLSVFRKDGDKYLLVAHANFAALDR